MRGSRSLALAAFVLVAAASVGLVLRGGHGSSAVARARVDTVHIDLRAQRQTIDGFGSSVRVWSDPHMSDSPTAVVPQKVQAEILTALYRRLGLTRSRQVLDGGIEDRRGGPFDFAGKLGEDQVAFVKQAKTYGLTTFFPGPVYIEGWMKGDDPEGYVNYALKILEYWRSKGAEPPAYALMNEPQNAGNFPPQWMHDVVLQLGRRLKAEGFKTKLVIPDDENPGDAYRRAVAVLEDPEARQYVVALAYHVYRDYGEIGKMRELGQRYKLPVWMTEYQQDSYVTWNATLPWAVRMHELLTTGGVSAIDYIWGFFGKRFRSDTMISIDFENSVYRGYSYTPLYWMTGQYSRFVRPGYVRVEAGGGGDALVTAFKGQGRLVVVAVNASSRRPQLRFAVGGGRLAGRVSAVRSSEKEQWATLPSIRLAGTGFSATLTPGSITTFVARLAR